MSDENILDDFTPENPALKRRRNLLPWWIKTFIWLFMIMGGLAIPVFLLGLSGMNFELSLYGLTTHQPISYLGILLMVIFLTKGITAYSLWAEEDWAINAGYIDAFTGIVVCLFVMFGSSFINHTEGYSLNLRGELLLLVPYLVKLKNIKTDWDNGRAGK